MNERVITAVEVTKKKFWWKKNEFGRSILEFEHIASRINSTKGKEQKFWEQVMEEWKIQERHNKLTK